MGSDRKGQRLPVQGRGREAVIKQLRTRRHPDKQDTEPCTHIASPLRIQINSLPPMTHAPDLVAFELEYRSRVAPK